MLGLNRLISKIFGSANDRQIKKYLKVVQKINELESSIKPLADEELKAKTAEFKKRLADGSTLDDILPEAFAVVREAAWRVLGERHYDIQLVGGMVLHDGKIAEMKTGEGKTLTSTAPIYLNALSGKGVHVVTVNDYLAKRDSEWMGRVFAALDLKTGCITNDLYDDERQEAYAADITYGTNNEFGFDYLRDNMKYRLEDMVQRAFNFAIVDEVDSILIDEARTPLIISGAADDSSEYYEIANRYVRLLEKSDYELDEKSKNVTLTDAGAEKMETWFEKDGYLKGASFYAPQNISLVHHVNQALRAQKAFQKDVDYIVKDNRIYIVDEFTGRVLEGRRYSDGLHQAIEAKENVKIQLENQTLASVTYQNYFRMYPKLAGMTGTAITEATEFHEIYKLDVIEVPTHRHIQRKDHDDEVYRTRREKLEAIVQLVKECHNKEQPVLLGTVSIESSEYFSRALSNHKIPHRVLNARHHDKEAEIIANAGMPGAITIATNMAGRGTDIKLGGNYEAMVKQEILKTKNHKAEDDEALKKRVKETIAQNAEKIKEVGGLYIIGTERHESRRIDNQLRGRAGRQGDPGESKFFLSLEDDLMRIFGSERLDSLLQKFGLKEGEPITHPWVNKALERAQKKVEARNYDVRKHYLKYDDVLNEQRKIIYAQRRDVMNPENELHEDIVGMHEDVMHNLMGNFVTVDTSSDNWHTKALHEEVMRIYNVDLPIQEWAKAEGVGFAEFSDKLEGALKVHREKRESALEAKTLHSIEKDVYLRVLDHCWKDHLHTLDHLREGIYLRSYAQKDPLHEYKREAYELFQMLLATLAERVVTILNHMDLQKGEEKEILTPRRRSELDLKNMMLMDDEDEVDEDFEGLLLPDEEPSGLMSEEELEGFSPVPRNAPCPCGSGKKYKQCHGKL